MKNRIRIKNTDNYFKPNNIYCVGKNYSEHIKELGGDKIPENPVIFLKPNTAVINAKPKILIPSISNKPISSSLHYETEMVLAISNDCYKIEEEDAINYILGYAVGLDMTLRDVQSKAKSQGLPWTISKGFYTSAPMSDIILKSEIENPMDIEIKLEVNNTIKQLSNTGLMIHNIYKIISYISSIFYLKLGDLIFTGTPSGVSEVFSGDVLTAYLGNFVKLKATVE